jgi:hypothetical protein
MTKASPSEYSNDVLDKHFEDLRVITKSFISNTEDDYKECSVYAAFIAWA